MSKINRINSREKYNITSNWLNIFANNLVKNSHIVEVYRKNSKEKFATIEDKMADMKKRVGFDKINREGASGAHTRKSASACGCNVCDTCKGNNKNSDILLKKLVKILEHIKREIESRDKLSYIEMLHDCRNLPEYSDIENLVSQKKLTNFIKRLLKEKKDGLEYEVNDIEHIPFNEMHQFDIADDMKAPYMRDL